MSLRIACLQMNSSSNVDANLDYIQGELRKAYDLGVKIIQLPENYAQMPARRRDRHIETAEQGRVQEFVRQTALQYEMVIMAGSLPVVDRNLLVEGSHFAQGGHSDEGSKPAKGSKPFARCLIIDDVGECLAHYDKIHLFDVDLPSGESYRESDVYESGDPQKNVMVVTLDEVRLGPSICYDLRFPELYRMQSQNGVNLIGVPSAFTYESGKEHWRTLLKARAIENLAYVFAAAQCGIHADGRKTWGHSMIVDPWGEVLAEGNHEPGLVWAEIDLSLLHRQRLQFPALKHRRISR